MSFQFEEYTASPQRTLRPQLTITWSGAITLNAPGVQALQIERYRAARAFYDAPAQTLALRFEADRQDGLLAVSPRRTRAGSMGPVWGATVTAKGLFQRLNLPLEEWTGHYALVEITDPIHGHLVVLTRTERRPLAPRRQLERKVSPQQAAGTTLPRAWGNLRPEGPRPERISKEGK